MPSVALRLLGALLLGLAGCAGAPPPEPDAGSLALQPYVAELRWVALPLAGKPRRFLLDTAGGHTLVTPALAQELGCRPWGAIVGYRMDGERVQMQHCGLAPQRIGPWPAALDPAVFDLHRLLPPELPPLDGVLALDALRGLVLRLDWPGGRLAWQAGPVAGEAPPPPLRLASGLRGEELNALLLVPGARGPLGFLVDSGDLAGTLVAPAVLSQGLLPDAPLQLPGRAPLPLTRRDIHFDGVLGTAFLMQGPLTLDLRAAR